MRKPVTPFFPTLPWPGLKQVQQVGGASAEGPISPGEVTAHALGIHGLPKLIY